MSTKENALHLLMENARNNGNKKRSLSTSSFACPAGCGARVTGRDINDHLDQCRVTSNNYIGANDVSIHGERQSDMTNGKTNTSHRQPTNERESTIMMPKRARDTLPATAASNAFSHMMKQSAAVFSKSCKKDNGVTRHRFHLHNTDGLVTWTSGLGAENNKRDEDTPEDNQAQESPRNKTESSPSAVPSEEIQWSTIINIKRLKGYELIISSSLPTSQGDKVNMLVRRHSRLSVS